MKLTTEKESLEATVKKLTKDVAKVLYNPMEETYT